MSHIFQTYVIAVFHLEVVKVDLDIAYVYKTSRAREGWGVVETGMDGDDDAAGDRARWGWAAASDVRTRSVPLRGDIRTHSNHFSVAGFIGRVESPARSCVRTRPSAGRPGASCPDPTRHG
jgi:hypothetical protein